MITATTRGYEDHMSYRKVFVINIIEKGLEQREQKPLFAVKKLNL